MTLPACRQQMAEQPSYRPLRASSFFADDRSARPQVQGTIARGTKEASGKQPMQRSDWARIAGMIGVMEPMTAASRSVDWTLYRDTFPAPVTLKMMQRGQERFNIYCAVCHDRAGTGKGMIVERGFTPPPSFHTDWSRGFRLRGAEVRLKDAPVGYFFEIITHGFGAMPAYAEQAAPDDRWAIIAYIRALQFSQSTVLAREKHVGQDSDTVTSRQRQD